MTPERENRNEEMRRRRRERHQQTQKKQQRQAVARLFLVLAALAMTAALIIWTSQNAPDGDFNTAQTTAAAQPIGQEEEDVWETEPYTVIHVAAAGDLNVTDEIVKEAMTVSGYNFSNTFLDVAPVLGAADLTLLNYEGTLARNTCCRCWAPGTRRRTSTLTSCPISLPSR